MTNMAILWDHLSKSSPDDADAARNLLRYCAEEMEHVDESINGAFLGWHYGLEVYL